ncbi:uncharacterized protein LOC135952483 [Calliphora vicina]|uniref:uncharacterized protein LOC135952483 n=1 Tax=Calliphora vicina TaxID=7373 RepID=UPI00325A7BD7
MKLLYAVIILGLIQLVVLRPLEASTSLKKELMELFENKQQSLVREFCEKTKVLSKNILQDEIVQQAATPVIRKFKQQLRDFLHDYPSFIRYGLIYDLVLLFDGIIPEPSSNPDKQYIWELLIKQGYDEFFMDFQNKYVEFVQQQFLPKLEELKLKLSQNELQHQQDFLDWCNELKQCKDYDCHKKLFDALQTEETNPKEELYDYIRKQLEFIHIFYGNSANDIAAAILKDQKLSQLKPAIRQHLIININNFIMKFESNQDINELNYLVKQFFDNILQKFYYNTDMPSKDARLLVKIFNNHGYAKFLSKYRTKFNNFMEKRLFKKFKEYKNTLNRQELRKEKTLIKCFVNLKALNNFFDRYDKFQQCFAILQKEFEIKTI